MMTEDLRRRVSLAEKRCARYGRDFAEQFRYQYVLGREPDRNYSGWSKANLGDWTLHYGSSLPIADILDQRGRLVGWLLGIALSDSGDVCQALKLSSAHDAADFAQTADQEISKLAGRYIAVVITDQINRVYHDPVADMPIIFDRGTQKVASSLGLLLDRAIRRHRSYGFKEILSGKRRTGFGDTLDAEARYCLPNHYLDLNHFDTARYWPRDDIVLNMEGRDQDVAAILDEIIARLNAHIGGLSRAFPTLMPVTGGRDSRILFAAAGEATGDIDGFICHRFHNMSRRDAKIGKQLTSHMSLPFTQFFKMDRTVAQIRDMRLRMGWSGHRGEALALASMEQYPKDHIVLRGQIMELLRATKWQDKAPKKSCGASHLASALDLPREKVVAGKDEPTKVRLLAWIDTLPMHVRDRTADLGYVEMWLFNYQGSYFCGFHQNFMINPFNDRYLIERAISLPPMARKRGEIVREIIHRANPELLEFPFN